MDAKAVVNCTEDGGFAFTFVVVVEAITRVQE